MKQCCRRLCLKITFNFFSKEIRCLKKKKKKEKKKEKKKAMKGKKKRTILDPPLCLVALGPQEDTGPRELFTRKLAGWGVFRAC